MLFEKKNEKRAIMILKEIEEEKKIEKLKN